MQKFKINGEDYIKVRSLREEIRYRRRNIHLFYANFSADQQAMVHLAYNDIIKILYREELKAAKTPEEHEAILEMPGDFLVLKKEGKGKTLKFFAGWENGEPTFAPNATCALWFDYESKAEEIMEALNEKDCGWSVLDMSPEAHARRQELLKAIFEGAGDEDENQT